MNNFFFLLLLFLCSLSITHHLHLDFSNDEGTELGKLKRHIAKGLLPQIKQKLLGMKENNVTINTTTITNTVTNLNEGNSTNITSTKINNVTIELSNATEVFVVNETVIKNKKKVSTEHYIKQK